MWVRRAQPVAAHAPLDVAAVAVAFGMAAQALAGFGSGIDRVAGHEVASVNETLFDALGESPFDREVLGEIVASLTF
jgi:hypothetical protein